MGVDCSCLVNGFSQLNTDDHQNLKVSLLQQGNKFLRPALLGLTSQEVFVRLSDDTSHLAWKTTKSWTGEEKGQVDLTDVMLTIKSSGTQGIQFWKGGSAPILEINAESSAIRDEWIVTLGDMRTSWKENVSSRPQSSVSAEGFSNRAEYFAKREAELLDRKKESEEKKKKYSVAGMKYTAQIMLGQKS
jgi:hypothetical protein